MIAEGLSPRAGGPVPITERLRALRDVPGAGVDASWLWSAALILSGVILIVWQ